MHPTPFVAIALAAFASLALAQNQVWIVDQAGGPGSISTDIQPAVDSATDGDVILVRSGTYGSFAIDDKSVSVVADSGVGSPPKVTSIIVRNLAASRRVVLRGLATNFVPSPFTVQYAIGVLSNLGPVVLESCQVNSGNPGIRIADSKNALLTRCFVQASGTGISASNSNVHLYESGVLGGNGGDSIFTPFGVIGAGAGSPGVTVESGKAIVVGSTLVGGNGGHGVADGFGGCTSFGLGGSALELSGVGPFGYLLDSDLIGGTSASTLPPCSNPGLPVPALSAPPGSIASSAEKARSLVIDSPVREGTSFSMTIGGKPGDATFLLMSFAPTVNFTFALSGTLLPSTPFTVASLLTMPPAGTVTIPLVMPPSVLPPGIEVIEMFAQVVVPGATGAPVVGSGTVLEIIDGSL